MTNDILIVTICELLLPSSLKSGSKAFDIKLETQGTNSTVTHCIDNKEGGITVIKIL
jgi:hypothetical protein